VNRASIETNEYILNKTKLENKRVLALVYIHIAHQAIVQATAAVQAVMLLP